MVDGTIIGDPVAATPNITTRLSRPRFPTTNVVTTDITHRFRDAASKILPRTLVKDEQFTLFESVGALEIGDPKMDSGCLQEGEDLDPEYDLTRSLLPEEVLWLMDELLSREVAWHMGYPLSQTLFTSVYVESLLWPDPAKLSDASFIRGTATVHDHPLVHTFFRAYCLGLIKSCDLVLTMVKGQFYYEEEDFATQLFNRELLHRFDASDILATMDEAFSWLDLSLIEPSLKSKLNLRLHFRCNLLKILAEHSSGGNGPLSLYEDILVKIQASVNAGRSVPDAFSPKIQRRLASTIPPRPMVTIEENDAFQFWRQALRDMVNAFSLLAVTHSNDLLTTFSTLNIQKPQPCTYVRALMQSFLSRDNKVCGRFEPTDCMITDLRSLTLAGSPILGALANQNYRAKENNRLIEQQVYAFLGRIQDSYFNLYRTFSLNRCRVRRTLCHATMEWDQIQAEAEELDDQLQNLFRENPLPYPPGGTPAYSYSISSWIYHYKLMQIRLTVQLGFELSVYAPYEIPGMYWYLSHVCSTHLSHLERVSYFVSKREVSLPRGATREDQQQRDNEECRDSLQMLYRHFSFLKATEALARGLHLLYTVLCRHGQFPQPAVTYASDHLRYELRMKPFLYLSIPEPVQYHDYERLTLANNHDDEQLLLQASSAITIARKSWEEVLKAKWHAFPLTTPETHVDSMRAPVQSIADTKVIEEFWTNETRGAVKATIATSIAISNTKNRLFGNNSSGGKTLSSSSPSRAFQAQIPKEGDRDYWHSWWLVPRIST